MESKICSVWKNEKLINNFNLKYSECKKCNRRRSLKRYYGKKDKKSHQQKINFEKN